MRKKKEVKFYRLDNKKHGVGGIITTKPTRKKQDRRAKPEVGYTVVFFPTINGLGPAGITLYDLKDTLAATPETAKARFMDRLAPGCTWKEYAQAGRRIRKIKITDLGDA